MKLPAQRAEIKQATGNLYLASASLKEAPEQWPSTQKSTSVLPWLNYIPGHSGGNRLRW
jgi:hypothetical protein